MKKWAQIINDQVVNTVVQASQPQLPGVWVEITGTDVGVGHVHLGDGVYGPPTSGANRHVTRLAFGRRFTTNERVALELASLDDPTAQPTARQQAAAIRVYLADVAAAKFIDLNRPDTRAGVQALEAGGLLSPGRALEILDAPVQAHELP